MVFTVVERTLVEVDGEIVVVGHGDLFEGGVDDDTFVDVEGVKVDVGVDLDTDVVLLTDVVLVDDVFVDEVLVETVEDVVSLEEVLLVVDDFDVVVLDLVVVVDVELDTELGVLVAVDDIDVVGVLGMLVDIIDVVNVDEKTDVEDRLGVDEIVVNVVVVGVQGRLQLEWIGLHTVPLKYCPSGQEQPSTLSPLQQRSSSFLHSCSSSQTGVSGMFGV